MALARESPQRAAEVLTQMPNELDRAATVDALVKSWASSDLVAASAWVAKLPDGSVRDNGAAQIADSVLRLNPRDALSWADSIRSNTIRNGVVSKILDHIKRTDPTLWEQISKTR